MTCKFNIFLHYGLVSFMEILFTKKIEYQDTVWLFFNHSSLSTFNALGYIQVDVNYDMQISIRKNMWNGKHTQSLMLLLCRDSKYLVLFVVHDCHLLKLLTFFMLYP